MTDLIYHSVKASNDLSSGIGFTEFNTIDFNLVANGRKMMTNSIRICGQVEVQSQGAALTAAEDVKIDHKIGAHGFFESFQCEISNGPKAQVLENLASYPRFVSMADAVSRAEIDVCEASLLGELRGATDANGFTNIQKIGTLSANATVVHDQNPSFAIKPMLCFNRMVSGSDNYSFNANGSIRISCNLARAAHALFGQSCQDGTATYTLKNIRLTYVSIPDDGKQGKIMMDSYAFIKSNMISTQANVQARVPARAVSACSITAVSQANENSLTNNSYALESLPQLDELNFSFQDTLTNYITYTIDDLQDALTRGVKSFPGGNAHNNSCNPNQQAAQRGYILGTDFDGQVIDLSGQKFGVSIKSLFNNMNNDPRLLFLYFHNQMML
tara:strand:- start:2655 stop:3812 length:1158 start_codon:yes stop_codon:yes gene_type:complete